MSLIYQTACERGRGSTPDPRKPLDITPTHTPSHLLRASRAGTGQHPIGQDRCLDGQTGNRRRGGSGGGGGDGVTVAISPSPYNKIKKAFS
jgi:hypothetical protein